CLGVQEFGLRSNAGNFTLEEMAEGVEFAKKYGAKIYVTTNIFAHNENMDGLAEYLKGIEKAGGTGIIVDDQLIIATCKRVALAVEVHFSTQQSVSHCNAGQYWKAEALHRNVLAHESSYEEMQEFKEKVEVEIEEF
ncbi:collagenase-like protease, partial [Bacillus anthracis]|uniref:peptidase U32 family protein n=1 Tax=Bacillus anthracis TaxID=1392 RepID=UPI00283E10DE